MINHLGTLSDASGDLVADSTYSITFALHDDSTAGSILWSQTLDLMTSEGQFSASLGPVSGVDFGQPIWLGMTVNPDPEMTPRAALTSVPSAFGLVHPYRATVDTVASAFWLDNAGAGTAIIARNTGMGKAGHFQNSNASNPSPVLEISNLGVGPGLHTSDVIVIETVDLLQTGSEGFNEDLLVYSGDAHIGLYSNPGGSAGSGIQMGEISGGVLSNKWSIYRETIGAGSNLRFTYGADPGYTINPTLVKFDTSGVVTAAGFAASGVVTAAGFTASGNVTAAGIAASGDITTAGIAASGNVTAAGFVLTVPDTLTVSVSGNAFSPEYINATTIWDSGVMLDHDNLKDKLIAPLSLPDGAAIQSLTCTTYDIEAASDLTCGLCERTGTASCDVLAIVAVTGQGGVMTHGEPVGSSAVVDNKTKSYHISVFPVLGPANAEWKDYGANLEIVRAHVTYTVDGPR